MIARFSLFLKEKKVFRKWNNDTYNTGWSVSGEMILLIYMVTLYLVSKLKINPPLPSIWWQMFILLWDSHHSVFLLTQLLQNKPSINLSATLPFPQAHCTPNKQVLLHSKLMVDSFIDTFPVDLLYMASCLRVITTLGCHRKPLLLLNLNANKLCLLTVSSLMLDS